MMNKGDTMVYLKKKDGTTTLIEDNQLVPGSCKIIGYYRYPDVHHFIKWIESQNEHGLCLECPSCGKIFGGIRNYGRELSVSEYEMIKEMNRNNIYNCFRDGHGDIPIYEEI